MKKLCFFVSLFLVNTSPFVYFIGLYNNIKIWDYCLFGVGYLMSFSLSYFTEQNSTIWLVLISIIFFILLVDFLIIFSYIKKKRLSLIVIAFCILDCIGSLVLKMYLTLTLDIILCVLIFIGMKKAENISHLDSMPTKI